MHNNHSTLNYLKLNRKQIKRIINNRLPAILSMVLTLCIITSCNNATKPKLVRPELKSVITTPLMNANEKFEDMREIARNEKYVLFIDEETTGIAIKDTLTGLIWRSIPIDNGQDNIVEDIRNEINSMLLIKFSDKNNDYFMNSYADSVSKNQFKIVPKDNGVRIDFTLGRGANEVILPMAITEKRMNELILNKIDGDRNKRKAILLYTLYSKETAPSEEDFEKWKKEFPILETTNIYVYKGGFDREILISEDIFKSVGYTSDMAIVDNNETGQNKNMRDDPFFKISLDLQLTNEGLSVKVPTNEITYNNVGYNLNEISIMPYFCAGKKQTDGYTFIPDGSGSIIRFNNEKTATVTGKQRNLYGVDSGTSIQTGSNVTKPIRMPVFGVKNENAGMIAIIEQGDAIAKITTTSASVSQPYFSVYSSYVIKYKEEINFSDWGGAGFKWTVSDKNEYKEDIIIRYNLLTNNLSNYAGMAKNYRNYLIENKILNKNNTITTPLFLEVSGSFNRDDKVFGIPMKIKTALTTYDQCKKMLEYYTENKVENIKLKYIGWGNGGISSTNPSNIKFERVLGGKKGWNDLVKYASDKKIEIFPDVDFSYVSENKIFDDFIPNNDAIRRLNNKFGGAFDNNMSDGNIDTNSFMIALSPETSYRYSQKFMKKQNLLQVKGLSVTSIGSALNSDFSKKKYYNRENAKLMSQEIIKPLAKTSSLMLDGGNSYLYEYTNYILKMPMTSSDFQFADESVPFMQMVLHGYIDYAGEAINLSGNYENEILLAVANGGGVYFSLNYSNTEYLKNTEYSPKFSTSYSGWQKDTINIYNRVSSALSNVVNAEMIDYIKLTDMVFETVYSNGISIITNFGDIDYIKDEIKVNAKDFILYKNK